MDTVTTVPPDLDRRVTYSMRWSRTEGICRLRTWNAERLAVVTELDDNTGPSVTNAIESIGDVLEAIMPGVRFLEHPTMQVPTLWQLVEHYPPADWRGATVDLVRFRDRDAEGRLEGPAWTHLRPSDMPWLWDALAGSTSLTEWADRVGCRVIFTYHHGEEVAGVVTSTNDRFVFVRFGTAASSEACEPARLRLAQDSSST